MSDIETYGEESILRRVGDKVSMYNPQNEMFSHFGTKRYNFKNETQFSRLYPTPQKFKKIDRLRRNEIHLKAVRTSS